MKRKIVERFRRQPIFFVLVLSSFMFWVFVMIAIIVKPNSKEDIPPPALSENWCINFKLNDNLSCGEESLINTPNTPVSNNKEKGFEYFRIKEYQLSAEYFDQARNNAKNDPELLIYRNNAKLMNEGRQNIYTIAVVIPFNNGSNYFELKGISESLLRGIALFQEKWNQNLSHSGLKILVASDENQPTKVNQLAENIISKNDVLAVIGHYTSDVIKSALPVYQNRQVVVVSASGTANRREILNYKQYNPDFFFRTTPNEQLTIPALIDSLQIKVGEKVAVFYNPRSTYSASSFDAVQNKLGQDIIINTDIIYENFDAFKVFSKIKKQGAKALIFIPDGNVNRSVAFKNTLSLIDVNNDELPMGGSNILYGKETKNRSARVKKLRLVIPWHRLSSPNQQVMENSKNVFGSRNIDFRTALAYDAILVLARALKDLPPGKTLQEQRLYIQKTLADPNFIAHDGATGSISFENGDRKQRIAEVVRVVSATSCDNGAMFVPIQYPQNKINSLTLEDCSLNLDNK